MATKVFVTEKIPDRGILNLQKQGYEVTVSEKDGPLTREELVAALTGKEYNAVLSLLTNKIDDEVFDAAGKQCKIFANFAVGYDNINLQSARERSIYVTNTPDVLTETVAEHTFGLLVALAHRMSEGDRFMRKGLYKAWGPMLLLGTDVFGKTLGVVGLGRIGARVAHLAVRGFEMKVIYYDVKRNEQFEKDYGAVFAPTVEELLPKADFVSIHVPLLESTTHLMNDTRLKLMKKTAYLINTARGPIVEEEALYRALRGNVIAGAALDVYEKEPKIDPLFFELENVLLTPHTASATIETRQKMSEMAANNIIEALSGRIPPNIIVVK